MHTRQGLRSITSIGLAGVLAVGFLAGCSGSDESAEPGTGGDQSAKTWQGRSLAYEATGQDFYLGQWRGQPGQVTVTCSGAATAPTVNLTSPDGDRAVIQPGSGGAGATVTVTGADGAEAKGESTDISTTSGEIELLNTPDEIDDAGMQINGRFSCQTG